MKTKTGKQASYFSSAMEPLGRSPLLVLLACMTSLLRCDDQLEYTQCTQPTGSGNNFFQYKIDGLKKGEVIDFNDYRGNVVLAVNVATF